MVDENGQLCRLAKWRAKRKPDRTKRLGDVLSEIMERRISPRQAEIGPVVERWGQLLPAELGLHCRITDISGDLLKVQVDSPSYMHELRMCSSELLEQLRQQCPQAKIKRIKFIVG